MKIVGRILIILAVFALVMGITYVIVNARSSSGSGSQRPGSSRQWKVCSHRMERRGFPNGERPEFPGGGREFRGERGGGGWLFGAIKNIAMIGIIVALIVCQNHGYRKEKRQHRLQPDKKIGSVIQDTSDF